MCTSHNEHFALPICSRACWAKCNYYEMLIFRSVNIFAMCTLLIEPDLNHFSNQKHNISHKKLFSKLLCLSTADCLCQGPLSMWILNIQEPPDLPVVQVKTVTFIASNSTEPDTLIHTCVSNMCEPSLRDLLLIILLNPLMFWNYLHYYCKVK